MEGNDTATEQSAQDITGRIESQLYGSEEPEKTVDEKTVLDDAEELPESDDVDSDEEEDGSVDEEKTGEEQEETLATYLGVDEERVVVGDDGSVSINTIVDGETKAVPLKDVVASYQLQGHVNNKSMALETERKEFEEQQKQVVQDLQTRSEGVMALSKVLENQLVSEYNSIDWERLRTENPAEWTALRQEYSDKANQIQSAQSSIVEDYNRNMSEQQKKMETQNQQDMNAEFQKVLADNPDWVDETKRKEQIGELRTFLSTYGYADGDMDTVSDHRLIRLIKDAKSYRDGKKIAASKKVNNVPKFQKSSAAKASAANASKARSIKAKRAAVKKTGSIGDVAKLLLDRM